MIRYIVIIIFICISNTVTADVSKWFEEAQQYVEDILYPNKTAYRKLAYILTSNKIEKTLRENSKAYADKNISDLVVEYNSLIMDLRNIKTDDLDIEFIRNETISAISQMLASLRMIQHIAEPDSEFGTFLIGATTMGVGIYTGSFTAMLGGAGKLADYAEKKPDPIQSEINKYLVGLRRAQDAKRLLPKIAKKIAGKVSTEKIVEIDINEPWGIDDFTFFKIQNKSSDGLENCTLIISLFGEKGSDMVQNVYFITRWDANEVIEYRYTDGEKIVNEIVGRTTVSDIDNVKVAFYCDEVRSENITYKYNGPEKLKDIQVILDDNFNLRFKYQPFIEDGGFAWIDQDMGLIISFEGLDYLPAHSIEVVAMNGNSKAKKTVLSSKKRSTKNQLIEFPDIYWKPESWIVKLSFNHPKIERKYTWKTM